jgi:hypothetical protein
VVAGREYREEKLRVRVKLTLRILKMRVGIVIVAKDNAHTNIRVTPNIIEAMKYNIQPIIPCEAGGGVWLMMMGAAEVRTPLTILSARAVVLRVVVVVGVIESRVSIVVSVILHCTTYPRVRGLLSRG